MFMVIVIYQRGWDKADGDQWALSIVSCRDTVLLRHNITSLQHKLHELPLLLGHLVLQKDLIAWQLSLHKVVDVLHQGWMEPFLEDEAELQAVGVVSLLYQCMEWVDVFVQQMLPLAILVPVL